MGQIYSVYTQAFPPPPTFIEKDIGDLQGKVYIVTGANTGLGKEIAQILYSKNAKVYCAARSKEKAENAITAIKQAVPNSSGELVFLSLDLADLSTIKATVEEFTSKEQKLNVLFNNAGVMQPPQGSKTAQGYELQLGVNNIGTFLFTRLLTPTLIRTAKTEPPASTRVIWVSSSAAENITNPKGGVDLDNLDYHKDKSPFDKYCVSKAGNYLHAVEYARLYKDDGVVSIPLNPGNLDSDLWRTMSSTAMRVIRGLLLHPSIYGAYTQLFAAFSPDITIEKSGTWVVPWGRFLPVNNNLKAGVKSEAEGGLGTAKKFWEWNEEQVRPFV